MSLDELMAAVQRYPASYVVVTGGEPMIASHIVELTRELAAIGRHITIETAGTVFAQVRCDLMSISPKLSNSTPFEREDGRWAAHHERLRYQPEVLARLTQEYAYQLKFVVTSAQDLAEIDAIRNQLQVPAKNIMLMPEGTLHSILHERSLWLAEVCKTNGFRFSPRLHIDLWGDRRGV
jgi:7-carboxy-7-deazaguanine synthase